MEYKNVIREVNDERIKSLKNTIDYQEQRIELLKKQIELLKAKLP